MDLSDYLDVAKRAAARAADCLSAHYADYTAHADPARIGLETKADQTPVTAADREAEIIIREEIRAAFPAHGIYGEELGRSDTDSPFLWLVDPLDGTRSFVRQYPFFSTQIALMHEAEILVGVSAAPLFNETAWAMRGQGAWLNDARLTVSGLSDLAACTLSTGNLATLATSPAWPRLGHLIAGVARNRGYGDFYHYHLLAAGKIDLVIESDVNVLDVAALSLIVQEAGGVFTDLEGRAIGPETRSVLAGTPAIHAAAAALL